MRSLKTWFTLLSVLSVQYFWSQCTPPAITTHPNNANVCAYGSGSMSVNASDASAYQWEESTDGGTSFFPLNNNATFGNVNTAVLSISNPSFSLSGNKYRCLVYGACSPDAVSNFANLTVVGPQFTSQPIDISTCENETVQFSASFTSNGFPSNFWMYSTNNGASYAPVPNSAPYSGNSTTTLTISGTTASMDGYMYVLKLGNGLCATISPPSAPGFLNVFAPPAPSNLASSNISSSSAEISWDPIGMPTSGYYSLEYREVGALTWISVGTVPYNANSTTLTGLSTFTNYEVQVQSFCSSSSLGMYSSIYTFSTIEDCSSPMSLNLVSTSASTVQVNWSVLPSTSWYEFRYKESSSGTWLFGGTLSNASSSKLLSGLLSNTFYDIQAKRYCSGIPHSSWSSSLTFVTPTPSGCSAPPIVIANLVGGQTATMTWTSIVGAAWYEFRYKPSSASTWISGGTAGPSTTSKTFLGLLPNTVYDFESRTFCFNNIPSAWGTINFTTGNLSDCELPPNLFPTAITTLNSIEISWTPVVGAAWYSFQYKESSSSTWISGGTAGLSVSSKIFTGLVSSTAYDFQVRTHCSNGSQSDWSVMRVYSTQGGSSTMPTVENKQANSHVTKSLKNDEVSISVFPNPVADYLTIDFSEITRETIEINILDMSGRLVFHEKCKVDMRKNIDLSFLKKGTYTLTLDYENKQQKQMKVVKF